MDTYYTKKTDLLPPITILNYDGITTLCQGGGTKPGNNVVLIDDAVLSETIAILTKIQQELEK